MKKSGSTAVIPNHLIGMAFASVIGGTLFWSSRYFGHITQILESLTIHIGFPLKWIQVFVGLAVTAFTLAPVSFIGKEKSAWLGALAGLTAEGSSYAYWITHEPTLFFYNYSASNAISCVFFVVYCSVVCKLLWVCIFRPWVQPRTTRTTI